MLEVIIPIATDPTVVPVVVAVPTLGILGIAVAITQIVMMVVNSQFGDKLAGKWKLLIVSGVAIVSAFLGQLTIGVTWGVALSSGVVVAAIQVFVHQIYTQTHKTAKTA